MKKELEFLEATKRKYGLEVNFDEPKPPTKGFVDLFNSASSPSATLLEGMVVLWAIEILFYNSCSYAATFIARTTPIPQQNSYMFPSYFLPSGTPATSYGGQTTPKNSHTTALREAVIENWKSENFGRFVDACRSIVDELAMAQTTGNGRTELTACERVFKQAIWLWGQIFPEVISMEQLENLNNGQNNRDTEVNGAMNRNGAAEKPVGVEDEDEAQASVD
uniref:Heme oxygenase-like protein n=1 Tax=Phoma sp. TaxID=1707701 RepID=A0A4D6IFI1_PHOSX|nr:heme oxygenase-like protein [Phoma sp.]